MSPKLITDILIVGAGPAGLSAARSAAETGLSVLVLEKSLEVGYPIHTSGGSWTRELREFGIPEHFLHLIHEHEFISSNSRAAFHYGFPEICVIDIRGVYQHLAVQASLAGAEILTNTLVKEPLIEQGKLCGARAVRNGQQLEVRAKLVIDASGLGAVLGRPLGLSRKVESFGNGAEYELIAPNWQQDKTVILLGSGYLPTGYAWVIPCGGQRVRVGFGVISPQCRANPLELLERFIRGGSETARQLQPVSIIETHLGSVPNSGYAEKTFADNLLIAGDSAGQVLGIAGEGIRLALEIGRLAGETAARAIRKNNTSANFLQSYETAWKKRFARSIEINARMNAILRNYSDAQWDKAVNILKDVDPAVVVALMKGYFDLNLVKLILTKNPGLFTYNAMKIIRKAITDRLQ